MIQSFLSRFCVVYGPQAQLMLSHVDWSQTPVGGSVTVSVVDPVLLPDDAVMVQEPTATAVAFPLVPAALLIVATAVFDELQVADVVRFCVEPSE